MRTEAQRTTQWSMTQDSGNNVALTLTKAAAVGRVHHITAIEATISGAAAANDINILLKDGANTIWKDVIGSGAPRGERCGVAFTFPLQLTVSNAASVVIDAGGAGVIATANLAGYTV